MTDTLYSTLITAAGSTADRAAFLAAHAADADPATLDDLFTAAHLTIKEIRAATGLTQAQFAARFALSRRTVEHWENNSGRECLLALRLLLASAAGIYQRPPID